MSDANSETTAYSAHEKPGAAIGHYTLLQVLGEGGFGTVYIARQDHPVQRQVALKILKLGMDTREVVARFEQERQALALMDHPHIARVLDAGATTTGRPYFVMELVKGEPITNYCDRNNLTIRERLDLFVQVCAAVQHAHTKGIIHRDLKPSNVLVSSQDDRPFARVIDFGIAKAISGRLVEQTIFTERGRLVGTPEYMSPEQADGSLDIDTRSDIYSLGALLYELLTGSPPFSRQQLRSAGYIEIQRIIREVDPPTPSARVSESRETLPALAAKRKTEVARLPLALRGELDWIVMKAMEKDRQRRYETANGLAMDVGRFLVGEPVVAAPASAVYRVRKFAGRHRAGFAAAAGLAAALVLGLGAALWQARVAARERDAARKAEAETRAVAEFQDTQLSGIDVAVMAQHLRQTLFAETRRALEQSGVADVPSRLAQLEALLLPANFTNIARANLHDQIFERAVVAAREQFRDQPVLHARLLYTIGSSMAALGLHERAQLQLEEALALQRKSLGDGAPATLNTVQQLGGVQMWRGALREAETLLRAGLTASRAHGPDGQETFAVMFRLAEVILFQGRLDEAERHYRESYDGLRRIAGEDADWTLRVGTGLGMLLTKQGKLREAEAFLRNVLDRQRRNKDTSELVLSTTTHNLAAVYGAMGRTRETEALFREAWQRRRANSGDDDPASIVHATELAIPLLDRGQIAEAESICRDARDKAEATLGPEHQATWGARYCWGRILEARGQVAEAERAYRDLAAHTRRVHGGDHVYTASAVHRLGYLLAVTGRFAEAEAVDREALEVRRRVSGPNHPETFNVTNNLAFALLRQGKFADAEPLYRAATADAERQFGRDFHMVGIFRMGLARALIGQNRFAEAEPLMLEAERVLATAEFPRGAHRRSLEVLVGLYESWEKASPGQGYGGRGAAWKAKLGASGS